MGAGGVGCRSRKLDRDGGVFFDCVFGCQATYGFADSEQELVRFLGRLVLVLGVVGRVCCYNDGTGFVAGPAGETLPELFGEEGHEGVDHGEATFEGGI